MTDEKLQAFRDEIGVADAHPYDCDCERCRGLHAAIAAQNPDGSYFFRDEELERLAAE